MKVNNLKNYKKTLLTVAIFVSVFMIAKNVMAAEVEVKMLTSGDGGVTNVFDPEIVKIQPGDSVHFVAVGKGHNVQSINSMAPDGAAPFNGQVSQDLTVKFDKAGVSGYHCLPHYSMGMVGLIVVGAPTNEDAAKAGLEKGVPPLAKAKFTKLFSQLDAK